MITREDFCKENHMCLGTEKILERLLKERDAYREVAKEFRKDLFNRMRIPYDHDPEIYTEVDAEAQRILQERKEGV